MPRYAPELRRRFPELEPSPDDLLLLEAHQVAELAGRVQPTALAVVLRSHPEIHRFLASRHPSSADALASIVREHPPRGDDDLAHCEDGLLWEIADWIVYQRCPELYDERSRFGPGRAAVEDVATVHGGVVVDAGAGTGQVTFALAAVAAHVIAVEPVARLREYMRERARREGIENVFVVDGLLHDMPLLPATADVLVTRNAIGWHIDAELDEIERVIAPSGTAVHLLDLPFPAAVDDPLHAALVARGYTADWYRDDVIDRRRYWKQPLG